MGAQRAPINSVKPLWIGLWEDITPLVSRGLPSLPMASSTRAHLSQVKRPPVHTRPSRLGLGNISRGPWQDTVAAPAGAVRRPNCPALPAAPFYLSRRHTYVDARKHTLQGDVASARPTSRPGPRPQDPSQ
jgi:hypothetical protein